MSAIVSTNIGKPVTVDHNGKELKTSIYKSQVQERIYLSELNFEGDEQADLIHHGGVDKAVCVYPFEHYAYWTDVLEKELRYGAFGENLTVSGLTEDKVNIGDTFQLGEAVVQISQPRQPCFKLAVRYGLKQLPLLFQETGYTGYYFRVLTPGWVEPSSTITLLEEHPQRISVQFANQVMHHAKQDREGIERLLQLEALSASWRQTLSKRLAGEDEADPKKRIEGK
jgi:MOSC domain-containing protein YiiM